jgi:hypothetical protein
MIIADEAISPDQITTSIRSDRVRIFYPRGQNQTILLWICDANPPILKTDSITVDNGFSQWIQLPNGDLVNPTDRPNAPACKIVGYK